MESIRLNVRERQRALERERERERESDEISVTRFGEISPKCQHFKSLWQLLESLLNIWQNVEFSLEILYAIGHIFIATNMGKYGKINLANRSL